MFGVDVGSTFGVRLDKWRHDGVATGNIPAPDNYFNPYTRLTIGGGRFKRPAELNSE